MVRLLVVEDESTIAIGLRDNLRIEGYEVEVVEDGLAVEARVLKTRYDLIVLDLMLPGRDGFSVCRSLRAAGVTTPVIVLSIRQAETDKLLAFELGADDYVTKPFSPAELVARIRAVLRRAQPSPTHEVYENEELRIDFSRAQARRGDRTVPLTATEFRILRTLIRERGRLVTMERLMEEVWGKDVFLTDRVVYTHINNIRNKLEARPRKPRFILGVRGLGYRFEG